VRHGDIIPFDDDIDVSVHSCDMERLVAACADRGINCRKYTEGLYKISSGDFDLDIMPVCVENTNLVFMGPMRDWFPKHIYPVTETFSRKYILGHVRVGEDFVPLVLNGPDDAVSYLEHTYGPGWRVPRTTHTHTLRGIRDSSLYGGINSIMPTLILVVLIVASLVGK
jgi:hypothetical protein